MKKREMTEKEFDELLDGGECEVVGRDEDIGWAIYEAKGVQFYEDDDGFWIIEEENDG